MAVLMLVAEGRPGLIIRPLCCVFVLLTNNGVVYPPLPERIPAPPPNRTF